MNTICTDVSQDFYFTDTCLLEGTLDIASITDATNHFQFFDIGLSDYAQYATNNFFAIEFDKEVLKYDSMDTDACVDQMLNRFNEDKMYFRGDPASESDDFIKEKTTQVVCQTVNNLYNTLLQNNCTMNEVTLKQEHKTPYIRGWHIDAYSSGSSAEFFEDSCDHTFIIIPFKGESTLININPQIQRQNCERVEHIPKQEDIKIAQSGQGTMFDELLTQHAAPAVKSSRLVMITTPYCNSV